MTFIFFIIFIVSVLTAIVWTVRTTVKEEHSILWSPVDDNYVIVVSRACGFSAKRVKNNDGEIMFKTYKDAVEYLSKINPE